MDTIRKPRKDYSESPLYRDKDGRRRRLSQDEINWIVHMAKYIRVNNDSDVDTLRHNIRCKFGFRPSRKWVRDLLKDKSIYKWRDQKLTFKHKRNNDLSSIINDILAILLDKDWGKNEKSFRKSMEFLLPEVRYYKGMYYNLRIKFHLTRSRNDKSKKDN